MPLLVEWLDRRELMSVGGLDHSLGPFVDRSPAGPRVKLPAVAVNPHSAVAQYLPTILGPQVVTIQAYNPTVSSPHERVAVNTILGLPSVRSVLANANTFQILRSSTFQTLIGSQVVSGTVPTTTQAQTFPQGEAARQAAITTALSFAPPNLRPTVPFAATQTGAIAVINPTDTVPNVNPNGISTIDATTAAAVATTAPGTTTATTNVVFSIPDQATVVTIDSGGGTALIQVNPSGGVAGFFAQVPVTNIRILDNGPPLVGSVAIPSSDLPAGYPAPTTTSIATGTFSTTYSSTGPLLRRLIAAGLPQQAPNAPSDVPGLRLVPYLQQTRSLPRGAALANFNRILRLAVQRDVFTLDAGQSAALTAGLDQFAQKVSDLQTSGAFNPTLPPDAPPLPASPLSGTLTVSAGVLRRLVSVDAAASGLQIPGIGNFPGRLDVGYVFDRSGNFGIQLTVRGPLRNATPDITQADSAAGDLRVEYSNAPNIAALTGVRATEANYVGSITSSDIETAAYANGVSTLSTAVGDGVGLAYGTATGYSEVIPLGNVYSLIPSAPKRTN